MYSAFNTNQRGDKIFQGGPNNSEILVLGGPKTSAKFKYIIREVQIFQCTWTGWNYMYIRGPLFV